jgi:hypothetical protein
MTRLRWVLCGLAALLAPADAKAAAPEEPPMQVRLVHGGKPGCEPGCPDWIAAQGKIVAGKTLSQFKFVLRRLQGRKAPVFLNSGGGDVNEALAIGRLIRTYQLDTAVIKTEFAACAAGDAVCAKQAVEQKFHTTLREMAYCASACAFVLAGGIRRFAGPWTQTGVHQIQSFTTYAKVLRYYRIRTGPDGYRSRTLDSERVLQRNTVRSETGEDRYSEIAQYFKSMGVGGNIMQLLRSAPNTSIHWMTSDELTSTQLITNRSSGLELLPGHVPAKPVTPFTVPAGGAAAAADGVQWEGLRAMPQGFVYPPPAPGTASQSFSERLLKQIDTAPKPLPSPAPPESPAQKAAPAADGPASAQAIANPSGGQAPSPELPGAGTAPPQTGPGPAP